MRIDFFRVAAHAHRLHVGANVTDETTPFLFVKMPKKRKLSDSNELRSAQKKPKVVQKYKQDYNSEWPVLKASSTSISSAFCTLCRVDFSVAHGGRNDCQRHINTKKHLDIVNASDQTARKQISGYFTQQKDTSVINAEVLFSEFLIEHNLPIAVADHAGPLFRAMFPDSEIAKKYGSGRTKTGALIETLARDDSKYIADQMRNQPFSIATDGSNDMDNTKLYPVTVR